MQELLGRAHRRFADTAWMPGNLIATFLVVLGWGYLIYTGNISTIWPLFGIGNQLLATIALAVSTTFLINMGKAKYALLTGVPMVFVGVTTMAAGILSVKNIFWPLTSKPGQELYRLPGFHSDDNLYRRRSFSGFGCGPPMDSRAQRRTRSGGSIRTACDRGWGRTDGLLLAVPGLNSVLGRPARCSCGPALCGIADWRDSRATGSPAASRFRADASSPAGR